MGLYDELANLEKPTSSAMGAPSLSPNKPTKPVRSKLVNRTTEQPTNQPVGQSANQSTSQSTDPLVEVESIGPIVERPRAFYITQRLDQWLDEAVRKLQATGLHKMDRSVLINGLLHNPEIFKDQNLISLRKRFLAHLTNKSIKKTQPVE
jgi:hypothetical protein